MDRIIHVEGGGAYRLLVLAPRAVEIPPRPLRAKNIRDAGHQRALNG